MKRLRALDRGLRLCALTGGAYGLWVLARLPLAAAPRARARWRRWIQLRWSRAVCRALHVRLEIVGRPPERALLVCNHLSYLDIPVIGAATSTVFVSRADVADWPAIGPMARHFGTIFVERRNKRELPDVNRRIEQALAAGDGVVVFPEGTSTKGDGVLPFRASLLAPAAEAGIEVYAATLTYSGAPHDPPPSLAVCWWGDAAFLPHVRGLLALESIGARLEFDPEPVRSSDRKELAEKLLRKVKSRFRPLP